MRRRSVFARRRESGPSWVGIALVLALVGIGVIIYLLVK